MLNPQEFLEDEISFSAVGTESVTRVAGIRAPALPEAVARTGDTGRRAGSLIPEGLVTAGETEYYGTHFHGPGPGENIASALCAARPRRDTLRDV